jgi:hypothetical protein
MISGALPFDCRDAKKTHPPIQIDEINYGSGISGAGRYFIGSLLDLNPKTILGDGAGDVEKLKTHLFFERLDWKHVGWKGIWPNWIRSRWKSHYDHARSILLK